MGERPAPVPGVDPLFTDDDAIEILEVLEDERMECGGCGEPLALSMAPENEFVYRAEPVTCHACAAKARAGRRARDDDGVYPLLVRKPV